MNPSAYVPLIAAAVTDKEVISLMVEAGNEYGFDKVMIGVVDPLDRTKPGLIRHNWPQEWFETYRAQDFFRIDPIANASAIKKLPFSWRSILDEGLLPNGASRQEVEAFFAAAAQFGLVDGIAIPLTDYGEMIGGVSFCGTKVDTSPEVMAKLHLVAIYGHARVREGVPLTGFARSPRVQLTDRQREVLQLIADGKTNWEIGRILQIEARTVRFHLEETLKKLGTTSRVTAVVRASALGLINID